MYILDAYRNAGLNSADGVEANQREEADKEAQTSQREEADKQAQTVAMGRRTRH